MRWKLEWRRSNGSITPATSAPCEVHERFTMGCVRCIVKRLAIRDAQLVRLREIIQGLLLGGQHDGQCEREDENGPCELHLEAAQKRDDMARVLIAELESKEP